MAVADCTPSEDEDTPQVQQGPPKQLDFDSLKGLYGRDDELYQLGSLMDRVRSGDRAMAFLHGCSGVGKTALGRSLALNCDSLFAMGKFDQAGSSNPFAAIYDSLRELCYVVGELIGETETDAATPSKNSVKDEKLRSVQEALGSYLPLLLDYIPELAKVLRGDLSLGGTDERNEVTRNQIPSHSFSMQKEAIYLLLKTMSELFGTVVWFLDDLQWASAQDIEIIKYVVSEHHAVNVAFLGAYRDDEVDHVHPLSVQVREIRRQNQAEIYMIPVGSLTVHDFSILLKDLVDAFPEKIESLARLVHENTNGNIFLAIQFLRMLQEKGLIRYSRTAFRWEWDSRRIRASININVSGYLVDIMIQQLQQETQEALRIASCLGSQFECSLIAALIDKIRAQKSNIDVTKKTNTQLSQHDLLSEAVKAGVIMRRRVKGKFRFAHDKFKEAAYRSSAGDISQKEIHYKIGSFLLRTVDENNKDQMLPLAASQLNRSLDLICDDNEKMRMAELNVRAAKCVIMQSAFFPASSFLESALSIVNECGSWNYHYNLKIEILKMLADVRYSIGDLDGCHAAVDEVKEDGASFQEKLPVLVRELELLGVEEKLQQAIDSAISILQELGDSFPRKVTRAHVVMSFLKTKLMLRGMTDEEILSLPSLDDSVCAVRLQVYTLLSTFCWLGGQRNVVALLVLRGMKTTLSVGASHYTAGACAGFGFLLCLVEDFDNAFRFASLALQFLERFPAREYQCRVLVIVYFYIYWLRKPLHFSLEPLLQSHQIGFETGDTQFAEMSAAAYCGFYLVCGLPLSPVEKDMRAFLVQMSSYRQPAIYALMQIYLQGLLNPAGHADNPAKLNGEILDCNEMEAKLKDKSSEQTLRVLWGLKVMLSYYFDDTNQSKEMLLALKNVKSGGFSLNVAIRSMS